ncbi:MAG TPA: cupin domain-containing protein, partial [Synergistales bacterium]|nr:cupin domain-containing protein [Synergistales bacterium]
MIIKDSQMRNVTSHPLFGSLKGIQVRSLNPDEFITPEDFPEQSRIHEISWVEMPSGTAIPEHKHEGCEEAKIIIYGMGMYSEDGFQEKVDAGDVIITQKG